MDILPSYEATYFLSALSVFGVSGALFINADALCRMYGLPYADYNYPTPWEAIGIAGWKKTESLANWIISMVFYAFLAKVIDSNNGSVWGSSWIEWKTVAKLRFRNKAVTNAIQSALKLPLGFFIGALGLIWLLGFSMLWIAGFMGANLAIIMAFAAVAKPGTSTASVEVDEVQPTPLTGGWKLSPIIWFGPLGFFFVPAISIIAALIVGTLLVDVSLKALRRATPVRVKNVLSNAWHGILNRLAVEMLHDPKYKAYLPTHLSMLMVPPLFAYCLSLEIANGRSFAVFPAVVYHLVRMGPYFRLFSSVHTLVHSEAHDHKKWFKPRYAILNRSLEWFLFPFYGGVPESYSVGHNKIHHAFTNRFDDVHSNLEYQRTSPRQFLDYLIKFGLYWAGFSVVHHMWTRGERRLAIRQMGGMALFYGAMAALFVVDGTFALVYYVFPHCEVILLLGAVSFTWHAWFEPDDLENEYVNSVTILDGEYNVFNQDYHVVHHQDPSAWWEDAPKRFEEDREIYKKNKATVFRKTQAFELFFLILFGNFERMADLFVDLSGTMTREEIIVMLKRRLGPIKDKSVLPPRRVPS